MNDHDLIALYFDRNEQASAETYRQFGGYCYTIAHNILGSEQDAEECVNDVLIRLWERIPPARPDNFYGYIAAVTRSIARNRYTASRAQKRGGGEIAAALDELNDCADSDSVDAQIDRRRFHEDNRLLPTGASFHAQCAPQRSFLGRMQRAFVVLSRPFAPAEAGAFTDLRGASRRSGRIASVLQRKLVLSERLENDA